MVDTEKWKKEKKCGIIYTTKANHKCILKNWDINLFFHLISTPTV